MNFFALGIPVSIVAGVAMHFLLRASVTGFPNRPWYTTSLPILAGLAGASALYFGLCRPESDDLMWELYSFNVRTRSVLQDDGDRAGSSGAKRYMLSVLPNIRSFIYGSWGSNGEWTQATAATQATAVLSSVEPPASALCTRGEFLPLVDTLMAVKSRQLSGESQMPSKAVLELDKALAARAAELSMDVPTLSRLLAQVERAVLLREVISRAERSNVEEVQYNAGTGVVMVKVSDLRMREEVCCRNMEKDVMGPPPPSSSTGILSWTFGGSADSAVASRGTSSSNNTTTGADKASGLDKAAVDAMKLASVKLLAANLHIVSEEYCRSFQSKLPPAGSDQEFESIFSKVIAGSNGAATGAQQTSNFTLTARFIIGSIAAGDR